MHNVRCELKRLTEYSQIKLKRKTIERKQNDSLATTKLQLKMKRQLLITN